MKNRQGLTLIEIILAIAILGIISIAFLTSMTSHFSLLNKTRDISRRAFSSQEEMEAEIDIIKEKIRNNDVILEEKTILNKLGGIKVNYYEMDKEYNGKKFYTLVSDIKPEIYDTIKLECIEININQAYNSVPYGYSSDNFKVKGIFKNKNETKWDHLLNIAEWYVASSDYIMPVPNGLTIEDDDYYYPKFPNDYLLVDNKTIYKFGTHEVDFKKLEEYKGRHIIFTATAGAKSGRIGEQLISKPVFISGLPIIENLIMHFDSAFINPLKSDEVTDNLNVKKWYNLSSILGKEKPDKYASNNDINQLPQLNKTEEDVEFKGQYIRFNEEKYLTVNDNTNVNRNLYLIALVRNREENDVSFAENGNNIFIVPKNDQWQLIVQPYILEKDSYIIGNANVDIAEIVIYEGDLNEEKNNGKLDKLLQYFNDKYK